MKILLLFMPLVIMACSSYSTNSQQPAFILPDNTAENEAILKAAKTNPETGTTTCNGKCGFVSTKTYNEKDAHYADCSSRKISVQDCNRTFIEMLGSRLMLEYPKVDFDKIVLWCKSEPKICDLSTVAGGNAFEQKAIDQQNAMNRVKYAETEAKIFRHNQELAEARQKAWSDAMAAQYQKQISCTATKAGNTTYTNCH
jgi:hypothetical protein